MNEPELIEAYIRNWKNDGDGDDDWAFAEVYNLPFEDPKKAWTIILKLLQAAPNKKCIAYIAAGPLQDLLDLEGTKMDAQLKKEAKENERLLYALAGIQLDEEDCDYYAEFANLIKTYDLGNTCPIEKSPWSDSNKRPGLIDESILEARRQP